MLTGLPAGSLGVVLASLLPAYMSTISTHLNWGSSHVVNDFYQRFVDPDASQRRLVTVGRVSTVTMMVAAALLALRPRTASQGFQILPQVGAGTGLLFILRWYWWRINAYGDIAVMVTSFLVSLVTTLWGEALGLPEWATLTTGVAVTTIGWLAVVLATPPDSVETLDAFCRKVEPAGPGGDLFRERAAKLGKPILATPAGAGLPTGLLRAALGCVTVYAALFGTGYTIYANSVSAVCCYAVATIAGIALGFRYRRS
ncbi:MAG: hypothetical protein AAGJ46_17335 [Planctomycetota bacterium]